MDHSTRPPGGRLEVTHGLNIELKLFVSPTDVFHERRISQRSHVESREHLHPGELHESFDILRVRSTGSHECGAV